ncbi:MAG: DUF6503 family protein, partial [Myxococcota bacterium]
MMLWMAMAWAAPTADEVLKDAAEAHGLTRDQRVELAFTFRGTPYRLRLDGADVRYERTVEGIVQRLRGNRFEVLRDGEPLPLPAAQSDGLRRSLNSVGYFATLPRPLFDEAVIATSLGRTDLAGRAWDTVEVRFREEGGGDDHDDVFRYWFDPTTHELGFLAYTFQVNEGGVRLRKVVARTEVDGVVLVDWSNHGWNGHGHTIEAAMKAYETGTLPQLSTIELDGIRVRR